MGINRNTRYMIRFLVEDAAAYILMVDSNDRDRLGEARTLLNELLKQRPNEHNIPLLVYANKQDLPGTMLTDEIV